MLTPENFYKILADKVPSCHYRSEWGQNADKTCVVINNCASVDGGALEGRTLRASNKHLPP